MSLDGALGIASGGLANIALGLSVVSQNVANVATPQYAVESATQQSLSASGQGEGVQSGLVVRATDPALQAQLSGQVSQGSAWQTTDAALSALQPVLGSVSGGTDLGSQLTAVQSAFSTLLADPADATQQVAVVTSAQTLARGINTLSQSYGQARQSAQDGLVAGVGQLNAALATIGSLSRQIVNLKAQGQSTADLENQRDQAENSVSQLVDARFVGQPDGDVTVLTGGGVQLPTDGVNTVSLSPATTGATSSYPGGGLPGIMLGGTDITAQMTGGSIGAGVALRDTILPTYQASLDEFAHTLSTRFADQGLTLFTGAGGTVPTATGPAAQDGYVGYAGSIQVNASVATDPSLVRDGTNAVAGSPTGASAFTPNTTGLAGFSTLITRVLTYALGSQAQAGVAQTPVATSGLGPSGTLSAGFGPQAALGDYANALTASQAADSANAGAQSTDAQAVTTSLQGRLTGETGVSMDTELGHMVALQNAYGANAKVISAVQAMFTEALAMVT
jgi:flagellar hook-associated protein 1 FlgK